MILKPAIRSEHDVRIDHAIRPHDCSRAEFDARDVLEEQIAHAALGGEAPAEAAV